MDTKIEFKLKLVNNAIHFNWTTYKKKYILQLILKKMLKKMSSDANLLCQTLRNLTDRAESCYILDNYHLNEFLNNEHGLNTTWRAFHPPGADSRILTTLQIYKAVRFNRYDY